MLEKDHKLIPNPRDLIPKPKPRSAALDIQFVNAAMLSLIAKLWGLQLDYVWDKASIHSITTEPVDLSGILEEYHDFADVFSKFKADTLALHHLYNLKINPEEGKTPLHKIG